MDRREMYENLEDQLGAEFAHEGFVICYLENDFFGIQKWHPWCVMATLEEAEAEVQRMRTPAVNEAWHKPVLGIVREITTITLIHRHKPSMNS